MKKGRQGTDKQKKDLGHMSFIRGHDGVFWVLGLKQNWSIKIKEDKLYWVCYLEMSRRSLWRQGQLLITGLLGKPYLALAFTVALQAVNEGMCLHLWLVSV